MPNMDIWNIPCEGEFYPAALQSSVEAPDDEVLRLYIWQYDTPTDPALELLTREKLKEMSKIFHAEDEYRERTEERTSSIGDRGVRGYEEAGPTPDKNEFLPDSRGYQYVHFIQDREMVHIESRNNCSADNMVTLAGMIAERLAKR